MSDKFVQLELNCLPS